MQEQDHDADTPSSRWLGTRHCAEGKHEPGRVTDTVRTLGDARGSLQDVRTKHVMVRKSNSETLGHDPLLTCASFDFVCVVPGMKCLEKMQ